MKPFKIVLVLLLAACFSCSKKSKVYRQLVQVDSVLYANYPDSAKTMLRGITPQTSADSAYYNILKTQTDYMLHKTEYVFTDINYSINYYRRHFDAQKLANAYYYKAMIDVDHDLLTEETALLLKEAEKLSEETSDNNLKNKICSALAYLNGVFGNYEESLKYAKEEYYYATKLNNNRDIAYGLLRLSECYERCGLMDSSKLCINECKKLAHYINNDDKAFVYSLLGESFMRTNIDSAQIYFTAALKYRKGSIPYQNLMEIYFAKNDSVTAKLYCDSALSLAWNKQKIGIYAELAQKYFDCKDINGLKNATDQIVSTHEKILDYDKNKFIIELQRKYDIDLYQQKIRSRVIITSLAGILLVAVLVLLHCIRVRRVNNQRMKAELDYSKAKNTLALLEERIAVLESDKKSKTKELSLLKEKAGNLKNEMQANLQHGHNLYDRLLRKETVIAWSDFDILCMLDFLGTINQEFVASLDNDYKDLNASQKLFLTVDFLMEKEDCVVGKMLSLERQSLRNKRNRIEKKRVVLA
ncbi:MAG: hypothetical protein J6W13_07315 [Salinivirgaceae bacterium]|nr:hypothetical protein [Salinivirgaceae bacterium]